MAIDVVVPEVGETGMDVTLVRWRKSAGEPVVPGDILFELDTDKTVVEVEAWTTGTLVDLCVEAGDTVTPRQVIARILAPGESAALERAASPAPSAPTTAASAATSTISDPAAGFTPGTVPSSSVPGAAPASEPPSEPGAGGPGPAREAGASPRARRLARERGLQLALVSGSGPDGLITERDVLAALGETPEDAP